MVKPLPTNLLLLLATMIFIVSCGTLSVRSSPPEAEVGVLLPGKEQIKSLGKTPFDEDLSELEDMVNEGTIVIVVSKRGYIDQQFIVPNLSGGQLEIEANLLPNLPSNYKEVNRIIALTLKAERFLIEKRFKDALDIADEIKKINENIASAYEIEASTFFLQNKLEESRFAWIRSLELEPNNPEAQAMLDVVEKRLGISSSGAGRSAANTTQ